VDVADPDAGIDRMRRQRLFQRKERSGLVGHIDLR